MVKSCIIIGAGMAGLTAAQTLHASGINVQILEKSKGLGGRMATRRIIRETKTWHFDHGAQFFTTNQLELKQWLNKPLHQNIIQKWHKNEREVQRFCSLNGMTALAKYLATDFNIHYNQKVLHITQNKGQWKIQTNKNNEVNGNYETDAIILTAPLPQSLALLTTSNLLPEPTIYQSLLRIDYHSCFALMLALKETSKLPPPGFLHFNEGPIASIADNQIKGVSQQPSLTIITSPEFTQQYFESSENQVIRLLLEKVQPYIPGDIEAISLHRWRYSHPQKIYPEPYLKLPVELPILIAGDAFGGPKVEGAFWSGLNAAQALLKV